MREICSYGSVGERGGNEPLYPETLNHQLQRRFLTSFGMTKGEKEKSKKEIRNSKFEIINRESLNVKR